MYFDLWLQRDKSSSREVEWLQATGMAGVAVGAGS